MKKVSGQYMVNSPQTKWFSVRIICEPGFEDVITSYIFESGFSGLEERTENNITIITASYCRTSDALDPLSIFKQAISEIPSAAVATPYTILSIERIPDVDWEKKWRDGLKAVEIGSRLVVRPSWVPYTNSDSRIEIIIDPKMAFGTGEHATTQLCLKWIEDTDLDGATVIDAGCGSGVLSIAAVKLGARSVFGFDHDPFSVDNAKENICMNGVQKNITIKEASLDTVTPDPSDYVLANMISGVLLPNLPNLYQFMKPEGQIIFSGLLAEEEQLFIDAVQKAGFRVLSTTSLEEWIAVAAEKNEP
ncbi:MAG: 50S ribosomal protein L11 methyltransferase [Candidatus Latescibacteria bacterium]|nr:50S ribosomal protein L11 methyltransferase [Candidatus Latescibacterota bacterium]